MTSQVLPAQIKHGLRDDQGRHWVPRGFVINTNDGGEQIMFGEEDYLRMVRLGANTQVIRLELGRLSAFPGAQLEESYLNKLVELTRLGREVGMKTVFKMTVYGVKDFRWEAFWANEKGELETYLNAWKPVWELFKDDESVVGYDLVNEPRKLSMEISYDDLTEQYLIPYYEQLISEASKINPSKMYLCQTIFMNKGEAVSHNQYHEIKKPIKRENVIFAPHIYQERMELIEPTMLRFEKESNMLDAPILIGEWGFPTFLSNDITVSEQLDYMAFYIRTAEVFDEMAVGSIKAWFLGTRTNQDFLPGGPSTWAIFSDKHSVGTVERKYITDIIARPYPQSIAGDLQRFMFNHATRTLEVLVVPDNSKGVSRIFVGANRHYPDGFSVHIGTDVVLVHNPVGAGGLEVVKSAGGVGLSDFVWDETRQQLLVLRWPGRVDDGGEIMLRIEPGIYKMLR